MKLDELYETLVYRGIGAGSNSKHIRWVSVDASLAKSYADIRGLKSKKNTRTVEMHFTPSKSFVVGNDREYLSTGSFIARAVKGSIIRTPLTLKVINEFREHFGSDQRPLIKFWSNDSDKKMISKMLRSLGYDSIKLDENGFTTYGILR